MAALPGNLLTLRSKLPALGGPKFSLDDLAQCLKALHGAHHRLVLHAQLSRQLGAVQAAIGRL